MYVKKIQHYLLKICVPHNTGASLNSSCLSISGASGISPPHLASELLGAEALGLNREICGVVRGVYVRVWGEKVVSCTFTLSSPPPSSPAPPYPSLDMSIVQSPKPSQPVDPLSCKSVVKVLCFLLAPCLSCKY